MKIPNLPRRTFVKSSSLLTAGTLVTPHISKAVSNTQPIKIGLVGCGGRGCGAVKNAMDADPNVELVAIGDLLGDRINQRAQYLERACRERYKVKEENIFVGLDSYKGVIDAGVDYVILTSPPVYRPSHLEYAVEKGIHCFFEKPVAVDAPGIRKVIALSKKAKEKNLGFMSGFCWRYNFPKREVFSRVLDGAVGEINALYSTYNTGEVGGNRGRSESQSDLDIQSRNWPKHLWLSGDSIVEQAVHSIDMMQWAMGEELPTSAEGTGGRQVYPDDSDRYGNIYDHFAVVYQWGNGARGYHFSRQQKGTAGSYEVEIFGKKGFCSAKNRHSIISGESGWRYSGPKNDMYKTEHEELIASIRKEQPINDGVRAANSTMVAIMGRMVAYTGKRLTFDQALQSKESLMPENLSMESSIPVSDVPKPGLTKFI
jgi:predicted dehydrogenase